MSIIVTIGMFLGVLSLAEVASMAPTSGGQYRTYPLFRYL
jgi:amino acid transporter